MANKNVPTALQAHTVLAHARSVTQSVAPPTQFAKPAYGNMAALATTIRPNFITYLHVSRMNTFQTREGSQEQFVNCIRGERSARTAHTALQRTPEWLPPSRAVIRDRVPGPGLRRTGRGDTEVCKLIERLCLMVRIKLLLHDGMLTCSKGYRHGYTWLVS